MNDPKNPSTSEGSPPPPAAKERPRDASAEVPEGLDQNDIEALLRQAQAGIAQAAGDLHAQQPREAVPAAAFQLAELQPGERGNPQSSLELLSDVELDLRIELGRTQMRLEEVLQLRGGSVVVLDKLAGDPVEVFVNGRLVARGEVLVMNDNFCVRVTELVGS